jgi:hypothetical protein
VFVTLEVAREGHCLVAFGPDSDVFYFTPCRVFNYEFRTCDPVPRAIVVEVREDKSIGGVRVVSRAEYDQYTHFNGPLDLNTTERWVILADEGRIQSVSISVDDERATQIYSVTNMQATQAFGFPGIDSSRTQKFACVDGDERYVCGFTQVAQGAKNAFVGMGVVYASQALPGALPGVNPQGSLSHSVDTQL